MQPPDENAIKLEIDSTKIDLCETCPVKRRSNSTYLKYKLGSAVKLSCNDCIRDLKKTKGYKVV